MRGMTSDFTDDAFLGGRLSILQPARGHRAGIDAVLLAAAIPVGPSATVLDVGSGSGVVGLCIATRVPGVRVTGVEIDGDLVALANVNAERCGLHDRARFTEGDVLGPSSRLEAAGLMRELYSATVSNPPFHEAGRGTVSCEASRRRASHMPAVDFDRWVGAMTGLTAPGGLIGLVNRAEAIGQLVSALENRFGDIQLLPVHPRASDPAHRLILLARKGSRAPTRLLPGLVLHDASSAFTPEVEAILRDGEGLRAFR
jgi:tRNA1(Val) A37 N6-methylase TrmN6